MRISSREWLALFPDEVGTVVVPIHLTLSVWDADDIARETPYVLDDDSLREMMSACAATFRFEAPNPGSTLRARSQTGPRSAHPPIHNPLGSQTCRRKP